MPPRRLTRQQAEALLYREARLLDERRFEEWLALFTDDGTYWLPLADGTDPEAEPSIVYDDRLQLAQRVDQLVQGPRYAQIPPSSTVHCISNVEVLDSDATATVEVRCNVLVFEVRASTQRPSELTQQRCLVARCVYRLRHEGGWRIASKTARLVDRDRPIHNLTFLL